MIAADARPLWAAANIKKGARWDGIA